VRTDVVWDPDEDSNSARDGSAYFDADGAGVCAQLIATGNECPLIAGSVPAWVRADNFEITLNWRPELIPVETVERLRESRFTDSIRRNVYGRHQTGGV
jgi:hypothetical protein